MLRRLATVTARLFEVRLPIAYNALEPVISENTLHFHFDKHHQGYVTKLNAMVADNEDLSGLPLEEHIMNAEEGSGLFNLAAQTWNHSFFWSCLDSVDAGQVPGRHTLAYLEESFGSFEDFQAEFEAVGNAHFGSGWNWLVLDPEAEGEDLLQIVDTHDAGNPLRDDLWPLLVVDLWEHAYYLDYQNGRNEYLGAIWDVINWENVEHIICSIRASGNDQTDEPCGAGCACFGL